MTFQAKKLNLEQEEYERTTLEASSGEQTAKSESIFPAQEITSTRHPSEDITEFYLSNSGRKDNGKLMQTEGIREAAVDRASKRMAPSSAACRERVYGPDQTPQRLSEKV